MGFSKSPDEADAMVLTLFAAQVHHGFHLNQREEIRQFTNEIDRAFYMATQANLEALKKKMGYVNRASYTKGIDSLVGKKYF